MGGSPTTTTSGRTGARDGSPGTALPTRADDQAPGVGPRLFRRRPERPVGAEARRIQRRHVGRQPDVLRRQRLQGPASRRLRRRHHDSGVEQNHLIKTVARVRKGRFERCARTGFASQIRRSQNVAHQVDLDTAPLAKLLSDAAFAFFSVRSMTFSDAPGPRASFT